MFILKKELFHNLFKQSAKIHREMSLMYKVQMEHQKISTLSCKIPQYQD